VADQALLQLVVRLFRMAHAAVGDVLHAFWFVPGMAVFAADISLVRLAVIGNRGSDVRVAKRTEIVPLGGGFSGDRILRRTGETGGPAEQGAGDQDVAS